MNNKITIEAFAASHPYKEERRAFARLFPNGGTWDELVERAGTGYQPAQDVLSWWATFGPPEAASFAERISAKRLCGSGEVSVAHFAQNCPADVPGADFAPRLAVQQDDFERVLCATYCPGGTPGADWTARLSIVSTPGNRALLGRVCPGGTPGATWEARLALQHDDYERMQLAHVCPADVPGADWTARLAVQLNAEKRALFGQWCPADVPGTTLEARLAVQMDDEGREWVAAYWGA